MGVVTNQYRDSFTRKVEELSNLPGLNQLKEHLEAAHNFEYQNGEIVELEDSQERHEITGRMLAYSIMFDEDIYMADRLWEDHDENLQRSYDEEMVRGDEII